MKTKRCVFSMLTVAMLATSCSNEIIETANDQAKEISFQTVLGKQTKATETVIGTLETNGVSFPLKAFETGSGYATATPFINGILTYNNITGWTLAAPVAQPGYSLTYLAWHPAVATFAGNATEATLGYTIETIPTDQKDLIVAKVDDADNVVHLQFNHILSQINFAIQGVYGVDVEISNLTLSSVDQTGIYNMTAVTPGWTITNDNSASYIYSTTGVKTDGTTTVKQMKTATNALMLMPQTFANSTDGGFTFTYNLYRTGTSTAIATGTASANFSDFGVAWTMGKRYVYNIDFTNYSGGPITFTVNVTDWADAAPIAQTLEVGTASKGSIEGAISTHNTKATGLSKFPIYVDAAAPGTAITLKDFVYGNFASGNQIIINFKSGDATSMILLDSSLTGIWSVSYSSTVATLTKI